MQRRTRITLTVAATATTFIAAVLVVVLYAYTSLWPKVSGVPVPARVTTLQALPESQLLYPGSHDVSRSTTNISRLVTTVMAYPELRTVAAVNASRAQVLDYFTRQLAAKGWTGPNFGNLNSPRTWTKGHYTLGVGFYDTDTEPDFSPIPGYATTYGFSLSYTTTP